MRLLLAPAVLLAATVTVAQPSKPLVSGEHGRDALELALEITKNMKLHLAPLMAAVHMTPREKSK